MTDKPEMQEEAPVNLVVGTERKTNGRYTGIIDLVRYMPSRFVEGGLRRQDLNFVLGRGPSHEPLGLELEYFCGSLYVRQSKGTSYFPGNTLSSIPLEDILGGGEVSPKTVVGNRESPYDFSIFNNFTRMGKYLFSTGWKGSPRDISRDEKAIIRTNLEIGEKKRIGIYRLPFCRSSLLAISPSEDNETAEMLVCEENYLSSSERVYTVSMQKKDNSRRILQSFLKRPDCVHIRGNIIYLGFENYSASRASQECPRLIAYDLDKSKSPNYFGLPLIGKGSGAVSAMCSFENWLYAAVSYYYDHNNSTTPIFRWDMRDLKKQPEKIVEEPVGVPAMTAFRYE